MSILLLCGGVGGAKLALGLARVLPPGELTVLVNTGDDFEHFGLLICPDIDTVLYTLTGCVDPVQGWGRADEGWAVLDELGRLGGETWFRLGDRDIALHLLRHGLLHGGMRLTQVTAELARCLGVGVAVLPMADRPVRTMVETDEGVLAFQRYFVERRCAPRVRGFAFEGAAEARLTQEVERAMADPNLSGIIVAPSNPFVSIRPILAVPGLQARLRAAGVPIVAVSPIVGGQAIKGPAAKMMAELGLPVSALSVAEHYGGFIDILLVDRGDAALAAPPRLAVADTVMRTLEDREALARTCLQLIAGHQA